MNTENVQPQFAVCVSNEGYPASLLLSSCRKLRRLLSCTRRNHYERLKRIEQNGFEEFLRNELGAD